ncbi:MAG TPA: DoxX family protein [Candidatus Koribacter sp.]
MAAATITMNPTISKGRLWTGRVLTTLVALSLVFDGATKVFKERHVLAAIAEMGIAVNTIVWIGALLLVCTLLYVIPRTSVLGAILLTGYLGGAVFANVIAKHPAFECWFPVIFGMLAWLGLYLREARLWELAPFRK